MKTIRSVAILSAACGVLLIAPVTLLAAPRDTTDPAERPCVLPPHDNQPVVQLALLLDTSNSMDGLIDQARTRLWQIVKDLARARLDARHARLEVALYEYGNNSISAEAGYIRQVTGFTDDLDLLSSKLFGLRTNGGDEFCGAVIDRALTRLDWSRRASDLKLVFIAGNEPFTQGSVDFRDAIRLAVSHGIAVNTIFCGPSDEGMRTGWREGAMLADGTYASIDQNRRMPVIDCPQDREIARLNEKLNGTYVAYGSHGRARAEMQREQDSNAAAAAPSVAADRTASKASALYSNGSWDLVDAVEEGKVDLDAMKDEELPDDLKGLSEDEREAKVAQKREERRRIQEQITTLAKEREAYVSAELKKLGEAGGAAALDEAVLQSVRAQAAKKNYTFTE